MGRAGWSRCPGRGAEQDCRAVPAEQQRQLHRAVNWEAGAAAICCCNMCRVYCCGGIGKRAPGCGTRSLSSLFSNPVTRHYRNTAKLQSLLMTLGLVCVCVFFSSETQRKPMLPLFKVMF